MYSSLRALINKHLCSEVRKADLVGRQKTKECEGAEAGDDDVSTVGHMKKNVSRQDEPLGAYTGGCF